MKRISTIGLLLLVFFAQVHAASAQQARTQIDRTRLTQLYDAYLQADRQSEYLQNQIATERTRIRAAIEKEIKTLVSETSVSETLEDADLTKALDRQRSTVALLEERLHESRVDLELLTNEEQTAYLNPPTDGGTPFTLTQSHADLLSRKAVLEENVSILESVIPVQRERLSRLGLESRVEQVAILWTVLRYILALVVIVVIERKIRRALTHKIKEQSKRYVIAKVITFVIYAFAFLWLITSLIAENPGILSSIAIVGAGLAVALQDVVKDVVGWMVIVNTRPFSPGDRISLGMHTGDVLDIGVFRTTLMEVGMPLKDSNVNLQAYTGNILYVPNARLLTDPLLNFNKTSDFIKAEMDVTVTYESDWRKAEEILRDVLEEVTSEHTEQERKQHMQRTSLYYMALIPTGPKVYTTIASSGIQFTLRFDVPIGKRRQVMSDVSRAIMDRFEAEETIEFAYNTTHVYSTPLPQAPAGDRQ